MVESVYEFNFTKKVLKEIYPDKKANEIDTILNQLKDGNTDVMRQVDEDLDADIGINLHWEWVSDKWDRNTDGKFETTYSLEN